MTVQLAVTTPAQIMRLWHRSRLTLSVAVLVAVAMVAGLVALSTA